MTLPIGKQRRNLPLKLLSNCRTWPFPILTAAKHNDCCCSGRCICQVEQILEQLFYLKTGIYLFQTCFGGLSFAKISIDPSSEPIIQWQFATNYPYFWHIWAYFAHFPRNEMKRKMLTLPYSTIPTVY